MKRLLSVRFLLLSASLVGLLSTERVPAAEANKLSAAVQAYVDKQELAGAAMLVADKDKVLACETVGYADVAAKKPMEKDSLFWIASQSKPITATALMMLVDEGKVNVDDHIEKYLPEFKGQMVVAEKDAEHVLLRKPAHPITVKNVLSHTSGLPFSSLIEKPTLDRLPLADRVRSYAMLPLDFEPDTKYQYSNAGINTAARIIEVVSGQSFEQFLDERLFRPLGMKDTTFWPTSEQVARLAKSYKAGPGNKGLEETTITQLHYPLIDRAERYPMPAGGLFSTAADLARFYQMILNRGQLDGRRYLGEAAVEKMTSRQTPANLQQSYGFGFQTGGNTIGHGGAYATNSHIEKDRGLILIWLVQHAGFPGDGKTAQDAFRRMALEASVK
ncbi:MAG TPA: serine hydrolase domain-containing protein [Pirellulales bacterium]